MHYDSDTYCINLESSLSHNVKKIRLPKNKQIFLNEYGLNYETINLYKNYWSLFLVVFGFL